MSAPTSSTPWPRRVLPALLLTALACLSFRGVARAQVPVIEPGREADVRALFEPFTLGADVAPGVRFAGIAIERDSIVATLHADDGDAHLVLLHPRAPNAPDRRSLSFALRVEGRGASRHAADALADAVVDADQVPFWRANADTAAVAPSTATAGVDGLLLDALLLVWLLGLLWVTLRREADASLLRTGHAPDVSARAAGLILFATTLLALGLRLWLAPDTRLGAWPYSRQAMLQEALFHGPGLAWVSRQVAHVFLQQDVVTAQTLAFSVATPAATFVLACALLDRRRVALMAAFTVSVLPLHLRFAQSEVSLVASLLLTSLFLAQLRAALRARSSAGATLGMALWLAFAPLAMTTRPLDLLLAPLVLGALLWLPTFRAPKHRRVVLGVGISVVAALVLVDHTLTHFGEQVEGGLSSRVLVDAGLSLFDAHNTLLNARITPPVLPALAALGALALLRQHLRLGLGVVGWLAAAYVAHAYVVPREVSMQARYHLHLVLPFALLVAAGVTSASARFPRALWPLLALMLLSPLLTRGFIEDEAFDPQAELRFVRRAAQQLPEGATVLEFSGGQGTRFGRLFDQLKAGDASPRFRVVTIDPLDEDEPFSEAARAALASGEELYIYEGIPCLGLPSQPPPTACAALLRAAHVETVLEAHPAHRVYDENLAPRLAPGEAVPLRLYRVSGATSARSR